MSWNEFNTDLVKDIPASTKQEPYKKEGWKKFPKKQVEEDTGPFELYLPFVFVSNPDTPDNIKTTLEAIGKRMDEAGYTVRLGGNNGIEETLEKGMSRVELHLPWKGFNERTSKSTFNSTRAKEISKLYSPVYDKLPDSVKAFLARNVRLLLGKDLKSPSLCLLVWTSDGCETAKDRSIKTGNAGHVISMASAMRIPIFNLSKPDALERLKNYLNL